jgi:hypothetical protein
MTSYTDNADYLTRLVAKTRRDDAVVLAGYGDCRASEADSARLLWALLARWPAGHFDELNVAVEAPDSPGLLAALGFMGPKVRRCGGYRMLTRDSERDVLRWVLSVVERDIGGLRLVRDAIGWCSVEIVGSRQ